MTNHHHLVVVDRMRHRVLAQPDRERPFPVVTITSRIRAADCVLRWLVERGITGSLLWSWLGRSNDTLTACDWLMVIDGDSQQSPLVSLQWRELSEIEEIEDGYQRLARQVVSTVLAHPGIFGRYTDPAIWPDVMTHVHRVIGGSSQTVLADSRHIYKVTPARLVAAYGTERRVYVKGSLERSSNERDVLTHLHAARPGSCPAILGELPDLGLQILEDAGPPLGPTTDRDTLDSVISRFAELQWRWANAAPCVPSIPIFTHDRLWQHLTTFLFSSRWGWSGDLDALYRAAHRAFLRLADGGYPLSLMHIDPTVNNIRIDACGARFIDFENAIVAPAPLACELILARLERANAGWPAGLSSHLRSTYRAWWHQASGKPLKAWDADVLLVAKTLVASVHWRVLCERVETGEWAGPLDLVWAQGIRRLMTLIPAAASP